MYGGSGKLGRGGGGGGGVGRGAKRLHSPFPRPPSGRPIAPAGAASGRLSIGGGAARNRHSCAAPAATPSIREESFSLESGGPLAFAMIIRLAPNLVDEIRRVESQGGTARIKFDSNANNASGNLIDVGGKDFRFTWSHEPGDLCDIYEECQSGEDGNGLLVEAGGAWRKLNVQRILDESTKNHVKMLSEEAERKLKSRKAIVLDHGNPSVKNQMKTLAASAVEMNTRRMPFKQPAFKKRKGEPAQAAGGVALKSAFKGGLSSTTISKGRLSLSPAPSPPEQLGASTSPIGTGNSTRSQIGAEEVIATEVNKYETAVTDKEMSTRTVEATVTLGNKRGLGASPMDLQSMLITLLLENPKGMSLKALEKAIKDSIPNCAKKIEPIIKKIANFQAPGRYILRPGVELESLKKPPSESGSSPEYARDQTSISEKATMDEFEQHSVLSTKLEESNQVEKIGIQQDSPDPFCDKKASDHSDGHACSSSESGSDSDSESNSGSDSGSGSESQSRSPVGSGSGSSSDSESDGSSSNKEGSDVDVDIMTSDDDKEDAKHKLQNANPEPGFSMSPVPWRNGQLEQNGFDEDKQDGQVSVGDETAKGIHDDDHDTDMVEITDSAPSKANSRILQDSLPFSPDENHIGEHKQLSSAGNFVDERPDKKDGSCLEPSNSSGKLSKPNSKMSSDPKGLYENSESAKRMKSGSSTQPQIFMRSKEAIFSDSPHYSSPDWPDQDLHKDQNLRMTDRVGKVGTVDSSLQRGYGLDLPGRPASDAHQLGQRTGDLAAQGSATDMVERPRKCVENSSRGVKLSERSSIAMDDNGSTLRSHAREKFSTTKDKVIRETQDEDGNIYEKSLGNNVRQVDVADKLPTPLKSQYRKQGEQFGRLKDAGQMANSRMGPYLKEENRTDVGRSPVVNGKVLRRELSDLELGELREPLHSEEALVVKKKFEKKNSFKLSENKSISSDNWNPDSSKGRTAGRTNQDSRKKCSPDSLVGVPNNQEDTLRKRITEDDDEESIMQQQRTMLPQAQHRADSEVGPQLNKSAELGVRSRNNEAQRNQVICQEGYASTHKKTTTNVSQQHDSRHEGRTVGLNSIKDGKSQKSNTMIEVNGRKDIFGTESTNNGPKRRESSSDDDSSYSKFEKDEPELKGPIKDISQYKEYVQEYLEKYDSYCSLNKSLETYRNDFSKLGQDLRLAKDGDPERYLNILEQLKENYQKCGKRHKRLKKIFILLHEELQHLKQRIKEFALTHERE